MSAHSVAPGAQAETLRGLSGSPGAGRGACRSCDSSKVLLHWFVVARRAQERGTDGGSSCIPTTCAKPISPCTTSWPMRPGVTKTCWRRCGPTLCRGCRSKGPIVAWIVDDTGFVKKGTHSVGVTRQYCGQVGKQENCRVAVSLSVSTAERACPLPGACTCRKCGPRTGTGERTRGYRRRSVFKPSRRLHWNKFAPP